eukprot:TRINITY_DN1110_c0_g1_i1.p1 TRINITY_DN1110_c0_g1~~TRINITY_DN1110_c0_g1_i1.p1  ORF type:complete len:354 (-),score=66.65 TRINITY_DN1110_c0_g1_i1:455-1441(-)
MQYNVFPIQEDNLAINGIERLDNEIIVKDLNNIGQKIEDNQNSNQNSGNVQEKTNNQNKQDKSYKSGFGKSNNKSNSSRNSSDLKNQDQNSKQNNFQENLNLQFDRSKCLTKFEREDSSIQKNCIKKNNDVKLIIAPIQQAEKNEEIQVGFAINNQKIEVNFDHYFKRVQQQTLNTDVIFKGQQQTTQNFDERQVLQEKKQNRFAGVGKVHDEDFKKVRNQLDENKVEKQNKQISQDSGIVKRNSSNIFISQELILQISDFNDESTKQKQCSCNEMEVDDKENRNQETLENQQHLLEDEEEKKKEEVEHFLSNMSGFLGFMNSQENQL